MSMRPKTEFERINRELFNHLTQEVPEQVDEVLNQKIYIPSIKKNVYPDINLDFLCFVDKYYYLSKIIPKNFVVIDFGCAYSPQAWYFKDHKGYWGVDVSNAKRFSFKNTIHFIESIEDFCTRTLGFNTFGAIDGGSGIFSICSYVSQEAMAAVRKWFKNVFCFYPHGEENHDKPNEVKK